MVQKMKELPKAKTSNQATTTPETGRSIQKRGRNWEEGEERETSTVSDKAITRGEGGRPFWRENGCQKGNRSDQKLYQSNEKEGEKKTLRGRGKNRKRKEKKGKNAA